MRAHAKEVVVTLTAEWLIAGLVCDTAEDLAASRLTIGDQDGRRRP